MPSLNWIGREAVERHHTTVPFHLIKADPKRSVGDVGSGNLLVEGDNLLALKALLPYYAGQVKCIYIDPPYNTGTENWIYNDNVNSPQIREWLGKVVGGEDEDLSRHDKWLSMMYPRLTLLRVLLREDGIIFVSVDENEHRHLELLMDEIFGSQNRIETVVWKKSYGGGSKSKHIVNLHEYVVCFAKRISLIQKLELPSTDTVLKYYKFKDNKFSIRGPYRLQPLATTSMDTRPNLRYPIHYEDHEIWPEKQWQWSKDRVLVALANDDLVFRQKGKKWTVSYKQYLKDTEGDERKQKPYSIVDGFYTQQGTNEIKSILGDGKAFNFPKPVGLVKQLIQMATTGDDLVLDSFAGSGTTGHAVLQLNVDDSSNRRFILVEMEPNIATPITAERLKRVIEGYGDTEGLGGSFQYCALGPTLFDVEGHIRPEVIFDELARFVYFKATGTALPKRANGKTPLLGVHNDTAVYLLYNGILKDRSAAGGNALTRQVLENLPAHTGPKIIYGTRCLLGDDRLRREAITFKHIPTDLQVE